MANPAREFIRSSKSNKVLNLLEEALENDAYVSSLTKDHKLELWRSLAKAYDNLDNILELFHRFDENHGDLARVGFLEADSTTVFMDLGDIDKADRAEIQSGSVSPVIQLGTGINVGKKPADSDLMLKECKLPWAHFQTRNVFKATYLLDEGMRTQALVYPFKYEVRVRLIIEQATNRLVLETPTGTFEATIMLEAAVELEVRYMKVDFTSLSDTQCKLLDSLSGAAKGPFLGNWFDAWPDCLNNDDEGILLLGTVTAEVLKRSVGDDLDAVQRVMAGIYLRDSNDKKAVPLLEAIVERESATLTLEDIHRLECVASLGKVYLNLKEFTKAIDMFRVLNDAFDVIPFKGERRLTTMYCLASAYLNVDQPARAAQLLEEVVIIEARLLPENHPWRLLSMRRLAQAYMELEKIRKLEDVVSLLQQVMQRGRETLHTDPQELAITETMLADARDTLAKTLQLQSRDQILASASAVMRWACREITSRAAIIF
ncbi:TPR-like protein [Aureobasidium pullulans]|nr:TPR-like protein [Aureobasidium pullulans]